MRRLGLLAVAAAHSIQAQNEEPVAAVAPVLTSAVLVNQIVLVGITAALAFMTARYWYTRHARDAAIAAAKLEKEELQARVTALEKQLHAFATEVQPISEAFRAMLIKQLTHFHTPVLDRLMEKIGPPCTLTEAESKQLILELQARERDMGPLIDDSERNAARLLPLMIERMAIETPSPSAEALQVVAVPVPPSEEEEKKDAPET